MESCARRSPRPGKLESAGAERSFCSTGGSRERPSIGIPARGHQGSGGRLSCANWTRGVWKRIARPARPRSRCSETKRTEECSWAEFSRRARSSSSAQFALVASVRFARTDLPFAFDVRWFSRSPKFARRWLVQIRESPDQAQAAPDSGAILFLARSILSPR